ncbi:DUF1398 family protein [Desemzia sp. FAM 24101]|uniref:DUF1398 family protein n=1 Tax=unclassified Desemzia TaxID=2685243 RepID=UPI0038891337
MSLNYQDIEQAVNAEENAGGFAQLMSEIKKLGVKRYDYLVAEGVYRYYDEKSFVELKMNGVPKVVADRSDIAALKSAVKTAQSGAIDFERFCELAGKAGVPFWTSNLVTKQVTYFDNQHHVLHLEPIPGV